MIEENQAARGVHFEALYVSSTRNYFYKFFSTRKLGKSRVKTRLVETAFIWATFTEDMAVDSQGSGLFPTIVRKFPNPTRTYLATSISVLFCPSLIVMWATIAHSRAGLEEFIGVPKSNA